MVSNLGETPFPLRTLHSNNCRLIIVKRTNFMKELEIALAIALTFLIFSTFSSMVVEVISRIYRSRFAGLQSMLMELFTNEIVKLGKHSQLNNDESIEAKANSFVSELLRINKKNHVLPVSEFIERLATSEYGAVIATKTSQQVSLLVNDLARKFADYSAASSFEYKSMAEKRNLIASIIIAFALNINIVTLTKTFQENKLLTDSLVSKTSLILEQAEIQLAQIEQQKLSTDNSMQGIKTSMEQLAQSHQKINELSLPVGWSVSTLQYFKNYGLMLACKHDYNKAKPVSENCSGLQSIFFWIITVAAWLFTTVLTGLLIGLGGPFWFDMVKRINVFKGFFAAKQQPSSTNNTKTTEGKSKSDHITEQDDLTTIFVNAYSAKQIFTEFEIDDKQAQVRNEQYTAPLGPSRMSY